MIKQIVFSLLLLAVFIGLTGCSSGKAVGLAAPGLTKEQVNQRHVEAIRVDWWQFQDDLDAAFLFDRPGRMHRLSVR
jgi:ABC-type long-subunit fatty acid transport system fused permease/ATPase subunit